MQDISDAVCFAVAAQVGFFWYYRKYPASKDDLR
jgi:hypothetical protein